MKNIDSIKTISFNNFSRTLFKKPNGKTNGI